MNGKKVTMDTHGVERVDFNALGGADVVTVNDLRGTDVSDVNVDLAGALGGVSGDNAADRVIVNGTDGGGGNDRVLLPPSVVRGGGLSGGENRPRTI
jgi:hypothetical protein